MSAKREYLLKHGWVLQSSRRRGMFRIEKWWKSGRGVGTMNQAYANERSHQAWLKLELAKKDVVEAEAALAAESQPATTTLNAASNLGYKETARN
jgi:hypothetical protein